jgi:tRNA A-37 threonylcarbamoyl transferase component Bud32/tetratricopeptide (TPR) repeat protein
MHTPGQRLGPYEIRGLLGKGGMGEVYLARDPRLGRDLALKCLPSHALEDDVAVDRFMREARTASALNHPNVVTIYEIGEAASGRFIAMELVEGETLRAIVDRHPTFREIARIGAQMARALAVAHSAGIIHRDVKPENVMLRRDGYVKVLDFGLARLFGEARQSTLAGDVTRTGTAIGTLRYMSPEQACAEPVTSASDVFSLGILLFEMATGRHPFSAKSDVALVSAILTAPTPDLGSLAPNAPPEFAALIAAMLEKDPTHRPSAADVESALLAIARDAREDTADGISASPVATRATVGRERERSALRGAWEQAAGGRGLLVSVSGEPGIGKTTLAEEFLSELAVASRPPRIARGRCSERLAGSDAYLPLLEALDALLRGPGAETVTALMKRLAPTWYAQIAASQSDGPTQGQATSQERLKRELGAFMDELCRLGPVVVFFDDLHWSDLSTIDVLAYLAARLGTLRLLIVATVRPAELLLTKHPFAQLRLDLQSRGLCREIALDFLSPADVAEFVTREFPVHALSDSFAAIIHAKTEGSPLFMTDLLRYLRTQGTVTNADGVWRLSIPLDDVAHSLPESIRGMIQRKIDQLSEPDRKLLAAASVQGYQFDSAIVAKLVGVDAADIEEALESLEHVYGFVRRSREHQLPGGTFSVRYRFVHVLYQNALFAALAPSRRGAMSAAAAEALLDAYGDAKTQIAVDLAKLFEGARNIARAVEFLAVGAEAAVRVFANQESALLARRGLELIGTLPETDARLELELSLVTTLAVAVGATQGIGTPEVGKAQTRAYELWKRLGARPNLFWIIGAMWTHHIVAGHLDKAIALGDELLGMAEATGNRAMMVSANNCLGITLHHMGEQERAAEHFARGLGAYGPDVRTSFIGLPIDPSVTFVAESGRVLWVLGFPEQAVERVARACAMAEEINHPESVAFGKLFQAFLAHFFDLPQDALAHSAAVIAISMERDIATNLAWAMCLHGWALGALGRIDEGVAELRASLAGQRAAGAYIAHPQFYWMLADILARAGRHGEARDSVRDGLETAARTGDRYWDAELHRLDGEIILASGGPAADAEQEFRIALADANIRAAKAHELRAATSLARLWITQGRRADARAILRPLYAWFSEGLHTADLVAARGLLDETNHNEAAI